MIQRWTSRHAKDARSAASRVWLALAILGVLVGCGGGGTPADEPAPPRETPLDLAASGSEARQLALLFASSLFSLTEQLALWVHAAAAEGWPGVSLQCPGRGQRTLRLDDVDHSGGASVGDTISVSVSDCHFPVAMNVYSGTVTLTLAEYEPGASLAGRLAFQADGLSFAAGEVDTRWGGALIVRHRMHAEGVTARRVELQAAQTPVTLRFSLQGITLTDEMRSLAMVHEVRRDLAANRTTMQFVLASDVLGGLVEVSTPQAFVSYFDTYPHRGIFRVNGAAGQRVEFHHGGGGSRVGMHSFVNDVPASFAQGGTAVPWTHYESGYLWWTTGDPPQAFESVRTLDQGRFAATVVAREVAPAGPFEVQLTRALQFTAPFTVRLGRLPGDAQQSDWGSPHLLADVQVNGALLTVQPREQLQPGRRYTLSFLDPMPVSERGELGLPSIEVPVREVVKVAIDVPRPAVLLPGRSLLLTARSAAADAADPIVSARWAQGVGPDLRLTPAGGDSIIVDLPPGSAGEPVDVPVMLHVTTASGVTDTSILQVRTVRSPSQAMMVHLHGPAMDPLLHGRRTIVSAGFQGHARWVAEYAFLPAYATLLDMPNLAVYFALPAGSPLQPGRYVDAVRASQRTTGPGIDMWFSSPSCGSIQGEFTLLEAQPGILTADGRELDRLAIDFEFSCDGRPPIQGSIRWHSDIALLPLPLP